MQSTRNKKLRDYITEACLLSKQNKLDRLETLNRPCMRGKLENRITQLCEIVQLSKESWLGYWASYANSASFARLSNFLM